MQPSPASVGVAQRRNLSVVKTGSHSKAWLPSPAASHDFCASSSRAYAVVFASLPWRRAVASTRRWRTGSVVFTQASKFSQVYSKCIEAVAGAVKETSQGTFAKGVDTKWPETQTVAKGVTSLLPRKSDEIFIFKSDSSVPPRG